MPEMDAATVLEEAADLLLIRGRLRGDYGHEGGPRCTVGAMAEVSGTNIGEVWTPAADVARMALRARIEPRMIPHWNDRTEDDFEVIDTLRLVAKDLRNEATA
jgi:hypothetical protein